MPMMHMKIVETNLYEVEIDLTDQQINDIENSGNPGKLTKDYIQTGKLLETDHMLLEFDKIG